MSKTILTKKQILAGLITKEDDHNLLIVDSRTGSTVGVFGCCASPEAINKAADDYLARTDHLYIAPEGWLILGNHITTCRECGHEFGPDWQAYSGDHAIILICPMCGHDVTVKEERG